MLGVGGQNPIRAGGIGRALVHAAVSSARGLLEESGSGSAGVAVMTPADPGEGDLWIARMVPHEGMTGSAGFQANSNDK